MKRTKKAYLFAACICTICICSALIFTGCSNDKNSISGRSTAVSDNENRDDENKNNENKDNELNSEDKEALKDTDENASKDVTENQTDEESSKNNETQSEIQAESEKQSNIRETENNTQGTKAYENSGNIENTGKENGNLGNNGSNTNITGNTPLEQHGALHVDGVNLMDEYGRKMQLYGMSTHGLSWFPQYVSYETFKTLRDDWNTNCIRLAMYTAEYNGYCTGGNREELKRLIDSGVSYATDLGMYVIIDWHVLNDNNPNVYKSDAIAFFNEMSAKYADRKNVIYEICNEPNGGTSWEDIKAYANEVIPVIRANDSDAVIIVGTPTWSQDIDKASASPLGFDNIMYALHFYAATHTDWLRSRVTQCINSGLPVFISEFGICDASGNGSIDYNQAQQWMSLIKQYNLSYCCWNLSNKPETSSVICSWCNSVSGWGDGDLSEAGKWIRNQFKS